MWLRGHVVRGACRVDQIDGNVARTVVNAIPQFAIPPFRNIT
jgi:hypothetical protein